MDRGEEQRRLNGWSKGEWDGWIDIHEEESEGGGMVGKERGRVE